MYESQLRNLFSIRFKFWSKLQARIFARPSVQASPTKFPRVNAFRCTEAMPTLLSLPSEILSLICNQVARLDIGYVDALYFNRAPASGDLAAVSRTCRLLHQVVEPMLYRCITTHKKFFCLFRTLVTREDLTSHVKRAYMDGWNYQKTIEPLYEEREVVKQLARQLSHDKDGNIRLLNSESVEWAMKDPFQIVDLVDEYHNEDEVGKLFLALTLLLLPRLEYLDLVLHYNLETDLYAQNHFQFLTEIVFKHWDTKYGIDLSEINGLLAAAPNVRVLRGFMVASVGDVVCHKSVRELYLVDSTIDADGLILIMNSFPFLEVFTYESGGTMVGDVEARPCDFTDALIQRNDTLRHVSIDLINSDECGDPSGALQSLQSMQVLETLQLDVPSIYTRNREEFTTDGNRIINLLPSSIKSLSLVHIDPRLRQDSLRLAQVAPKRFPHLKQVTFSKGDPALCEELNKAFLSE
ncbi:hypothetical protein TWF694_001312 [Orbilia ellipsospora]|uniref:F-box domain-containing protein n=1 Tax=Orbilia ellipsospora TaxID=2528407 RepID=A0AAV9XXT9_9PEZI